MLASLLELLEEGAEARRGAEGWGAALVLLPQPWQWPAASEAKPCCSQPVEQRKRKVQRSTAGQGGKVQPGCGPDSPERRWSEDTGAVP